MKIAKLKTLRKIISNYLHMKSRKLFVPNRDKNSIEKKTSFVLNHLSNIINNNEPIDQMTQNMSKFFSTYFQNVSSNDALKDRETETDLQMILADFVVKKRMNSYNDNQESLYELQEIINKSRNINNIEILYKVIGCNGFYQIAYWLREKYINYTLESNKNTKKSPSELYAQYLCALDSGNYQLTEKIISHIKARPWIRLPVIEMEHYLDLLKGKQIKISNSGNSKYSKFNKKFYELVHGKSIAIVGPAPSSDLAKDEIDSYDVVIRLNYRGHKNMPPVKGFGTKTNISYYNSVFSSDIENYEDREFFNDLDFVVFKTIRYEYQFDLIKKGKNVRTWNQYIYDIIGGKLNMIQSIILDILAYEPLKIKVFKANMYQTTNNYHPGYQVSKISKDNEYMWLQHWQAHDIVTHFNLTKNLWKNELIEVDHYLGTVLDQSCEDYVSNMDRIYSK